MNEKSKLILNNLEIAKTFENWIINLKAEYDLIEINVFTIQKPKIKYYSIFKQKHLNSFKLFQSQETMEKIFNLIKKLIDEGNVKIEKMENYLKFIISNNEFILDKKEEIDESIKNIIINRDSELYGKNKENKENDDQIFPNINEFTSTFSNEIQKSNNIFEKENKKLNELNKKINEEIQKLKEEYKKEIQKLKEENKKRNEEMKKKNEEIKNKNKELEERIKQLESFHNYIYKNKNEIQITKCYNLEEKNKSNEHKGKIRAITSFPSGNLVSVSENATIMIFDKNLKVIDRIDDNDNTKLLYVGVKDDNTFVTSGIGKKIKIYYKYTNEKFINYKTIEEEYKDIFKVIFCPNGNIITCANDKECTINIWEEENNNFRKIQKLHHLDSVTSILLLEDKNMFVSCGLDKAMFWNLNDYKLNFEIENVYCCLYDGLNRIDEDRIICGGKKEVPITKIISISQKKIIHEIDNNGIESYANITIKNKGIFLTGNNKSIINVYRWDNYEKLFSFGANQGIINSITLLNDGTICVSSNNDGIKIYSFEYAHEKENKIKLSFF